MKHLTLLFLLSTKIFAREIPQNDVASWILEQAPSAIKRIEEGKIYLDSSRIHLSNDQIMLIDDVDGVIPLASISSSEHGLYIPTHMFNIFNMWKCPVQGCGYWNSNYVNVCQNCYTPRDEPN